MEHIFQLLPRPKQPLMPQANQDASYFRSEIPQLAEMDISDETIERSRLLLVEYHRQAGICGRCQGYHVCGKEGDMRGFEQKLEKYGEGLTVGVVRCRPFEEATLRNRIERYSALSGSLAQDQEFQFVNFPREQLMRYKPLFAYAQNFADTYVAGSPSKGVYLFGPPGVGKTHLMLAVLNRLKDRGIPCLIFRSDSVFDRMRHIIADNGDLEPVLEAYASVPVLGIDEFAQERANDFTLEKLFRIVNHRFHAQLPTWFTSNYAPPAIYKRNGEDVHDLTGPLRSRIMQMAKLARIDGDDFRQRGLESLT